MQESGTKGTKTLGSQWATGPEPGPADGIVEKIRQQTLIIKGLSWSDPLTGTVQGAAPVGSSQASCGSAAEQSQAEIGSRWIVLLWGP